MIMNNKEYMQLRADVFDLVAGELAYRDSMDAYMDKLLSELDVNIPEYEFVRERSERARKRLRQALAQKEVIEEEFNAKHGTDIHFSLDEIRDYSLTVR